MITQPAIETYEMRSPRGALVHFAIRDDTTDWNTVNACCAEDEYGLRALTLTGWAMDIGAHIGGVTVALLADNPKLRVIAVEALPENVAILRTNLELNGFTDRAIVISGAADSGHDPVQIKYGDGSGEDFGRQHRFIGGGIWNPDDSPKITCSPHSLYDILLEQEIPHLAFMKIDCEGCEWSFLDDPAVSRIERIHGEYHPRNGNGPVRLRELLEPTHQLTLDDTREFGPFMAVRLL